MSIIRIAFVIVILYAFSLAASAIIYYWTAVIPWIGVIALSIVIFAVVFAAFVVALAIMYAVIKKPTIEEGDYTLARIKGKRD
jgi:hypothetical protein